MGILYNERQSLYWNVTLIFCVKPNIWPSVWSWTAHNRTYTRQPLGAPFITHRTWNWIPGNKNPDQNKNCKLYTWQHHENLNKKWIYVKISSNCLYMSHYILFKHSETYIDALNLILFQSTRRTFFTPLIILTGPVCRYCFLWLPKWYCDQEP